MSYGVTLNLNVPALTSAVCRNHVIAASPGLGLRDLSGALNFLSRIEESAADSKGEQKVEPTPTTLEALKAILCSHVARASSAPLGATELADVVRCALMLGHLDRWEIS